MKTALLVGTLAISTTLWAQAPTSGKPPIGPETAVTSRANPGTALQAELIRGLDARKAKPGDAVVARSQQDLKLRGEILIPKSARLIGHVVEAQKKERGKPESTLGIAFDKAILRDGREVTITASIQALAPPSILAEETGDTDLQIRNAPAAKPRTSGLLPGAIRTILPETPASTDSSLTTSTTGVVGLQGLQLESATSMVGGSVIHSSSRDVRLESGTRLILRVSLP